MTRELELAGALSAGGWLRWRKKHAVEPGTPCANCETALVGPYCHVCGQLAENFHRSLWHLLVEGVESFFHFDGRLWRTLPKLALKPGELTRAYLDGKRAYQIPPLRLFLVVLLVVFFAGGLNLGGSHAHTHTNVKTPQQLTPAEKAEIKHDTNLDLDFSSKTANIPDQWWDSRVKYAMSHSGEFILVIETWAHRLAVLMLPISALLLSGLYIFQRRFYVYDHLIFSMHSLSFQGLLLSAAFLLSALTAQAWWLLMLAPVHLFVHMRGVYGSSVFGTLVRMGVLWFLSVVGFSFLLTGLLLIGLNAMGGH